MLKIGGCGPIVWLSEWLREIILVILIALFLDFIIPNHALHRYVKVVISFFILLTILSPIARLLNFQIDDKDLEVLPLNHSSIASGTSLDEIIHKGQQIQQQERDQSIKIVEQRMEEQFMKDLAYLSSHEVTHVDVKMLHNNDQVEIDSVIVTIRSREPVEITEESDQITGVTGENVSDELVKPVVIEPVQIDIKSEIITAKNVSLNDSEYDAVFEEAESVIQDYAWRQWNVPASHLTVQIAK